MARANLTKLGIYRRALGEDDDHDTTMLCLKWQLGTGPEPDNIAFSLDTE